MVAVIQPLDMSQAGEALRQELGLTPDQALRVEEQVAAEPIDRYDMR